MNSTCAVIIDNYVVTKFQSGVAVSPIRLLKKQNVELNFSELPRISLGSRLLDNNLLSRIVDPENRIMTVEELIENYKPTYFGINRELFPEL
jgi:hypothetical protein